MTDIFYFRNHYDIIGIITEINKLPVYYTPKHEIESQVNENSGYPIGIYKCEVENGKFKVKRDYIPTGVDIFKWLSTRYYSVSRSDIEACRASRSLRGIENYWELAKFHKGASLNDYYWFSADKNEKYGSFHPRFNETQLLNELLEDDEIESSLK